MEKRGALAKHDRGDYHTLVQSHLVEKFSPFISIFHAIGHLTARASLPKFLTKEGFLNDFKSILVRVKGQEMSIPLLLICGNGGQVYIIPTYNVFRPVFLLIFGSTSSIGIINISRGLCLSTFG